MKKNKRTDEEIVAAFERLFDESLVPNSTQEAQEIIRNAGINPSAFLENMNSLTERILAESPHNWRNQKDDEIEEARTSLSRINIPKGLSKQQLLDSIDSLLKKFPTGLPRSLQLAHRNATEQSQDDLAYLYQEILHQLAEAGIDIQKDE